MNNSISLIHKDNKELFFVLWNNYLNDNNHSFIHTFLAHSYFDTYCKSVNNDLSFVVIQNNKAVGICYLPIETIDNYNSISRGDGYIPMPLSTNNKIEKFIFEHIESVVKEYKIKQIKFYQDSNIEYNTANLYNNLKKYQFVETNNLNLTVNLLLTEELLWRNLSKRYKSIINKYTKNTTDKLLIINKDNAQWKYQNEYYKLHKNVAKEYARDISLFEYQYKLIEEGSATLFVIQDINDNYIHFSLYLHHNNYVLSASSVSDESKKQEPLSHYAVWNANLYFKKLGHKLIQYGQPSSFHSTTGIDDMSDDKGVAISHFKRNMGAMPTSQYRGIKFYDKKILKKYLDKFYDSFEVDEK